MIKGNIARSVSTIDFLEKSFLSLKILFQKIGKARNDPTNSCGLHPATKAMQSEPKNIFVFEIFAFLIDDIQKYNPKYVNIKANVIGTLYKVGQHKIPTNPVQFIDQTYINRNNKNDTFLKYLFINSFSNRNNPKIINKLTI